MAGRSPRKLARPKLSAFPLLLVSFLAAACAHAPGGASNASDLPGLAEHAARRTAVSGNLLATVETNGKTVTTPAVLLAEWPDQLRVEVQDPVGGVLVLLVLNGDRFWLYQQKRAEILTGPATSLVFPWLPKLSTAGLVKLFLARPDMTRFQAGQGREARTADGQETLRWGKDLEPSEWEVGSGGQTTRAEYDDYEFKAGLHYPTKIHLAARVAAGTDERKILLAWKDWEPSVPKDKKLFAIPQAQTFGRKIKALR